MSKSVTTAVAVCLLVSCTDPIDRAPKDHAPHNTLDDLPVADDPADEPTDEPVDNPSDDPSDDPAVDALTLTVRFREPGQHVVINVQAVDAIGAMPLYTVPSAEVPQPFVLDDVASDGLKRATAHVEVIAADTEIVVSNSASFTSDEVAHVVGQAGPLPLEVCAHANETSGAAARFTLVCEGALNVTGSGIAALFATSDGGYSTWCNGVNLDGDPNLIPFTSPTTAEKVVPFTDGEACWPVDVHVGANTDDDKQGSGDASATFTFTARN